MEQLDVPEIQEIGRLRFPSEQLEVEQLEIHCLDLELLSNLKWNRSHSTGSGNLSGTEQLATEQFEVHLVWNWSCRAT